MGMHPERRTLAHGGHAVTYFGDWHTGKGGHAERRIISITLEHVLADRMMPTRVPRWSVVVTQQSRATTGGVDVLTDITTADRTEALAALEAAMRTAVDDGWAEKRDLERVPRPSTHTTEAPPAPVASASRRSGRGAHRAR